MIDRDNMIESYLDGKLSEEARREFERLMQADSVLERNVRAERMIRETLRGEPASPMLTHAEPSSVIFAKLKSTSGISMGRVGSAGRLLRTIFRTPIRAGLVSVAGMAALVVGGLIMEPGQLSRTANFGFQSPSIPDISAFAIENDPAKEPSGVGIFDASSVSKSVRRGIAPARDAYAAKSISIVVPPEELTAAALLFDGNDYIEVGNPPELRLSDALTLEAWVNPRRDYYNAVMCKGDAWYGIDLAQGLRPGFFFPRLNIDIIDSSQWYWGRLNLIDTIPEGEWTHLACTYDRRVEQINLYVNGVRQASFHATGTLQSDSGSFRIGARQPDSVLFTEYFQGKLDEIRVWNRARTDLEIQADMNRRLTGDEVGLVAYYSFDQKSSQQAKDWAGGHYGRLGTTPEEDESDPAWIESELPLIVTPDENDRDSARTESEWLR